MAQVPGTHNARDDPLVRNPCYLMDERWSPRAVNTRLNVRRLKVHARTGDLANVRVYWLDLGPEDVLRN